LVVHRHLGAVDGGLEGHLGYGDRSAEGDEGERERRKPSPKPGARPAPAETSRLPVHCAQ